MQNILILTVGTGTAGKYSDLASGLARTIKLLAPRKVFLVPSTHETSLAIAELLKEESADIYGETFPLEKPDDLEACRQHLRSAIVEIRPQLAKGEKLILNPTSGTKQMTAAATLAALDENIGEIVFTIGERADGVVKTGAERITTFDAETYFRERDLALAQKLFDAADFYAAERILLPYKQTLSHEYATAHTCYHWHRFDYDKARIYAPHLAKRLPRDIIADHLAWSAHALQHQDPDASVRLTYKALELAARLAIDISLGVQPNGDGYYRYEDLRPRCKTLQLNPTKGGTVSLGLKNAAQLLQDNGDPFGRAYFEQRIDTLASARNENVHGIRPASSEDAEKFLASARKLIADTLNIKPSTLPARLADG